MTRVILFPAEPGGFPPYFADAWEDWEEKHGKVVEISEEMLSQWSTALIYSAQMHEDIERLLRD